MAANTLQEEDYSRQQQELGDALYKVKKVMEHKDTAHLFK